jgi:DNA-directed RNA polymerase subunit M/transcription elongation factor TFIIS
MNFIWGSAGSAEAAREQARLERACVNCPACAFEIPLADTKRLPREFSLLCPGCGQREVYYLAQIHEPEEDAEAIRAPRKIQFGKKAAH